jgi:hypothetical protein
MEEALKRLGWLVHNLSNLLVHSVLQECPRTLFLVKIRHRWVDLLTTFNRPHRQPFWKKFYYWEWIWSRRWECNTRGLPVMLIHRFLDLGVVWSWLILYDCWFLSKSDLSSFKDFDWRYNFTWNWHAQKINTFLGARWLNLWWDHTRPCKRYVYWRLAIQWSQVAWSELWGCSCQCLNTFVLQHNGTSIRIGTRVWGRLHNFLTDA